MYKWFFAVFACLILMLSQHTYAYEPSFNKASDVKPHELEGVGIEPKIGNFVDLSTEFIDESGQTVSLGRYFQGSKPVIFSVVYFNCPSLCNYHLNGLTETMKKLKWTVGDKFELVALTMNHREGYELAAQKKQSYIDEYGRPESEDGWHFLTGTEENIKKITDQVGFGFSWMEEKQEYAHASAAIIMTPGGKISRYLNGIEFDKKDLRLALLEASNGKIGNVVDQIVMFCFQFDPTKNKYSLYAFNLMRLGAGLMVLVLAIILIPMWMKERKKKKQA